MIGASYSIGRENPVQVEPARCVVMWTWIGVARVQQPPRACEFSFDRESRLS